MKLILKKALITSVLFTIIFSSCKKKKSEDTVASPQKGTMTCKINGVAWKAKSFNNTLLKDSESGTKRIDIRGIDAQGRQLILTIGDHSNTVSGNGVMLTTYYTDIEENFDGFNYIKSAIGTFYINASKAYYTFSEGPEDQIVVETCNGNSRTISGTFDFDVYYPPTDSTVVITEGVFDTEY